MYDRQAAKDIKRLKSAGIEDKAKILIDTIQNNPYQNPPRYEKLVGNLSGLLSRRINIQHRIVYQVYEEPVTEKGIDYQGTVKIIRMWSHYEGVK